VSTYEFFFFRVWMCKFVVVWSFCVCVCVLVWYGDDDVCILYIRDEFYYTHIVACVIVMSVINNVMGFCTTCGCVGSVWVAQ
jgi:hypothetical protein